MDFSFPFFFLEESFFLQEEGSEETSPSCDRIPSLKDVHRFWGIEQKIRYDNLKTCPIVPGRVINLSQLKDSHCPIKAVRLFYTNLHISSDSGELETLVLGNHIIVNGLLFEDVSGTKFSGVIPYMNEIWPDDFEVSLEGAKRAIAEPDSDLSNFGPLSLFFEHRILAHIVATSLIPKKGSLSNISTRDVFVLYCLLRKYRINGSRNTCGKVLKTLNHGF
ncbi:hypothetical protein KY285_010379 [Solanum tuberosum]|nr:hypothetical protein KY289_010926 [Solanum tuberosum]KAH0734672.1 hypothetical protein KY285_010379 [Solanum tuberosum]